MSGRPAMLIKPISFVIGAFTNAHSDMLSERADVKKEQSLMLRGRPSKNLDSLFKEVLI